MATLDSTLGAIEIGILLSVFLYGIATVQVFLYTQSNYQDSLLLKLLVIHIWVLETFHTICICVSLYHLTVTKYGVPETIDESGWGLVLSAVLSAWIGAIIQAFFAYRVKMISSSWTIPIVSWSLSLLRAALGIAIGVLAFRAKTLTRYIQRDGWLVTTEFTVCATIDVLNTSSLCYSLMRQRQPMSRKLVDRIIIWSIETGLLTSVTVLAMLACSIVMPDNLIYIGILIPYAKLFSNSFLTSLNARRGLRQMRTELTTSRTIQFRTPTITGAQNQIDTLELSPIEDKSTKASTHNDV